MMGSAKKYINNDQLEEDRVVLVALKQLADYTPAKGRPTIAEIIAMDEAVRADEEEVSTSEQTVVVARSKLVASFQQLHEEIIRAKSQAIAQYGRDSNEIHSLGLTRMSDRKRPTRTKATKI